MLWNMKLRETKSLWVVILSTDGSMSAQEKVVILFGKALEGKINEYSEWIGDRGRRREFITME